MESTARQWLERQTSPVILSLGFAMVALIGAADWATGYETSLAVFYLAPVLAATWVSGRRVGLAVALGSAAAEIAADLFGGLHYSSVYIHAWNALVRVAFFAVVVLLLEALHSALERERRLARRDALTGLSNRAAFFETAQAELLRARRYDRPLTVVYVDCDHFKDINDAGGHEAGDRVLRAVAEALEGSVRQTDVAARLGGDEFALLFPELGGAAARDVVAKLQERLSAKMKTGGWPVTFSIGVVSHCCASVSVDALLQRADELMYEVKRSGRDAVRFAEEMGTIVSPAELRRAGAD